MSLKRGKTTWYTNFEASGRQQPTLLISKVISSYKDASFKVNLSRDYSFWGCSKLFNKNLA
jgi:hypothetical protein